MAKRVNKKFLLGLTIVVVGLVVVLLGAVYIQHHRNPAPYIAAGDKAMADERYEEAAESYHKAMGLDRGNVGLSLKFGDALDHLVSVDPQNLGRARDAWQNVLVTDPANVPAIQRLIQSYQDELEAEGAHPATSTFTSLHDASLKILKLNPSDLQAQATPHVTTIRQYLSGIAADPKKVDESVETVLALLKKDPGNSDELFFGVFGKLRRALDRVKVGDVDIMDKAVPDSTTIIEEAIKAQPDSASIQWRASQLYSFLASVDSKNAEHDKALAATAVERAQTLVTPSDPKYSQIVSAGLSAAMVAKDTARAEKIVRQYYANRPRDPQAQLALGQFLRTVPGKSDEAMSILGKPVSAAGLEGFHALTARSIEAERIYLVSMMRAEAYVATTDPARRKLLLDEMQNGLKSLEQMSGSESMGQLRLKARIHELKGESIEAMATYQRALNLMERNGVKEYDVMNDAARLDLQLGQTGSAMKLLSQIVDYNGSYIPARLFLAQIYLQQGDPDSAQQQLDAIEKLAPQSPELSKLRIAQFAQQKKPEAAKAVYSKLPESNLNERLAKAQLALQSKDYPEAIRLLETTRKEAPENASAMLALAQSYAVRDEKPKARDVIVEALTKNPTDRRLLIYQKQLENASPAELEKLNEQLQMAGADDYTREIQEYQLASTHGKSDEALKHLQAADKIKPDDKLVAQLYFEFYLSQGKFDLAKQEIPTLVRLKGDESDGWISRTRLAMARGDWDEAVKSAKEIVSRRPEFAVSYVLLGQAYLKSDNPREAVHEFQFALDRQSTNFDALKGLVEAYFANKQPEEAGKRIAEGRKLFPDSSQFRELALNYDLFYSSHPETAVAERAKILDASPEQIGNYLSLAQADVHLAQIKAGDTDVSKKYSTDAKDVLGKAEVKWPGDIRVVSLLAQLQQYLGHADDGAKLLLDLVQKPEWKDKPDGYRLLSEYYQRSGDLPAAEKQLRAAYAKSNNSVDVQLPLAGLLVRIGKLDDAIKLLSDNPNDPRVIRQRIATFVAAGKIDDAERATKEALTASPSSMDLLNLMTGVYLDARRPADARVAARNAIKVDRNNQIALFQQAKAELASPDPDVDLATRDLNALKDRNPAFIPGRLLLAQVLQRRGDLTGAIRELEDAVQISPLQRDARLALINAYGSARPTQWQQLDRVLAAAEADPQLRDDPIWLQRDAGALAVRKQFPEAIAKIRAALKISPDNPQILSTYILLLVDAKDYQGALQETDKLIAAGKKNWWIYYASGMARAGAGDKAAGLADLDKAIAAGDAANDGAAATQVLNEMAAKISFDEALHRAQKRAQEDSAWRLFVLQMYRNKGDWADAVKTAEAINADKGNLTPAQKLIVVDTLAAGYQSLGQLDKSRDAYQQWINLAPSDPVPLNNLAYMLAQDMHHPADAKAYSQKALQLVEQAGGDVNSIRDTHGWILTLCGGRDATAGMNLLQQAVDENGNFIEARYHLAQAYLRSARPDDAEEQLQKASALAKAIEANHGQVSPEIKNGIQEGLDKVRQLRSEKSTTADHS